MDAGPCEMKMSGRTGRIWAWERRGREEVFHSRDEDESQRGSWADRGREDIQIS